MNVVFLILIHKDPVQAAMLVDTLLATEGVQVLVHVDKKSEDVFGELNDRYGRSRRVQLIDERYKVYWGSYGQIRATLALMRAAGKLDGDFYCTLISGQDYPLKPVSTFMHFLEENKGRQFLVNFPLPDAQWRDGGLHRLQHFHFDLPGSRLATRVLNRAARTLQHRLRIKRPIRFRPYGGSNWFTLRNDLVRYVVNFVDTHPEFHRQFRHTRCADEIWLQSIVMNSPFASSVISKDLRFIDWSTGPEYPRTWRMSDLSRLLGNDGAFFARKFDPAIDRDVLDALREKIGN